jgi:hypothetical protein
MSEASYTYAVARSFDPALIEGLHGVDGAPVHLVRHEDLVAVVSGLASADAEESALRARLESLEELEAIARAHYAVVAAVAPHSVTLPLRVVTIYSGDARVAEVLRDDYARLCSALDRLAGRVELGVKVYMDSSSARSGPSTAAGPESATPGRDYLRQRRQQRQQREDAQQQAASAARRIEAGLQELAVDCRAHRPQDSQLSGAAGENILNLAYLVEVRRIEEFARRAARLAGEANGVSVVTTGPWAPYSFVDPGLSSHGGSGEAS